MISFVKHENAQRIFKGKIVKVQRDIKGGYNIGDIWIESFDLNSTEKLYIQFQNENLVAELIKSDGSKVILAAVPDLITIVDNERFNPILCEDIKYGLRVSVIAIPSVYCKST